MNPEFFCAVIKWCTPHELVEECFRVIGCVPSTAMAMSVPWLQITVVFKLCCKTHCKLTEMDFLQCMVQDSPQLSSVNCYWNRNLKYYNYNTFPLVIFPFCLWIHLPTCNPVQQCSWIFKLPERTAVRHGMDGPIYLHGVLSTWWWQF